VSAATDRRPFDVCGPLPTGVTVLEASAGTGKTYTIAGLTARFVAEGVPLEQLLVMTFTRNATAELRDRVRERLVSAERGLALALAGEPFDRRDEVLALLAGGDRDAVALRHRRLATAVADFDAATIVTTHGFCQEVLGGLGIAGDLEPGSEFVEDVGDLVEQVVDDLYVRAFAGADEVTIKRAEALDIAWEAVRNPGAPLEPANADPASLPGRRRRLAEGVRRELELRKRRLRVMSYDDLLTRLDGALAEDARGEIAERLRRQYAVVLVDEFQDTDPMQWRIVQRAFGEAGTTLVLIGDPKQAIYAFRGADVFAYLEAARSATTQETLDTNWRSDQGLLDAYDALFGDAQLGHAGIVYRRVGAAASNRTPRLSGAPEPAPLRVRVVDRSDAGTYNGTALVQPARELIAEDLAGDVVRLLDAGAEIEKRREDGSLIGTDGVAPGDIAVLVRRNVDAELVRDALGRANVPAVLAGAGSVFQTEAAGDWLRLLEALERPTSATRAHAAALTAFVGWSSERVAEASDEDWEEVHGTLHLWASVLRERGVAALAESASIAGRIPERVLAAQDGERHLTDVRHIGELLHAAAMEQGLGVSALTSWLRKRIADATRELGNEDRSRRLESDAAAVQILTIHRSKGLEFPIVYLPFLWDPSPVSRARSPVTFHDADHGDVRKVDVGLDGREYAAHRDQSIAEQRGEDLRLMYVALTRARHQAVVWWVGTKESRRSPLGRLVFARDDDGTVKDDAGRVPTDEAASEAFAERAAAATGCIAVERAQVGLPASWSPPLEPPVPLSASAFTRALDEDWRRTSYSDLTARTHEPHVASEPEEDVVDDEAPDDGTAGAVAPADLLEDALRGVPSLLSGMPGGVRIGTLVHDVMEAADFAAADLEAELRAQVARARARRPMDVGGSEALVAGLTAMVETPLGPLVDGLRLRDLERSDRLDELVFELPLAGGDRPHGEVTPSSIGAVLARHLPPDDPIAGYAERLTDPALRHAVRGYLTGSVDLLLRTHRDGVPRFAVVDYKTNRLGAIDEELTAWHHRPAALAEEMQRAHYVLQALLYTVAVHRFLRWRLPGYDPAANLAGILYLFVRGMVGPDTPQVEDVPCGVFSWRPPDAVVLELSDLFDAGAAA
jgi:exodeoxyribonuclease V beta subunit